MSDHDYPAPPDHHDLARPEALPWHPSSAELVGDFVIGPDRRDPMPRKAVHLTIKFNLDISAIKSAPEAVVRDARQMAAERAEDFVRGVIRNGVPT